jgi:hypothetical protein
MAVIAPDLALRTLDVRNANMTNDRLLCRFAFPKLLVEHRDRRGSTNV